MAHGFLNGSNYNEETMSIAQLVERTLTEFHVPAGVVSLGPSAFAYCPLTQIYLPEGIEEIGSSALAETTLTDITLPLSCGILKGACLGNNKQLTKIIFGKVRTIQGNAFKGDSICMIFDFSRCDSVPNLQSTNSFDGTASDSKILVPSSIYEAWINATNWSNFAERIVPVYDAPEVVVPDRVSEGLDFTLCGNEWDRYYEVAGLGDCADEVLVIPSEHNGVPVTRLVSYCFSGNTSIKEVYIPESIADFGYAFENCTNLEKIYVDASGISSFEFCNISPLKYVKFGRLTFLGGGTFADCTGAVFDFSECTAIPEFDSYGYGREFGANPMGVVPLALYDEWKVNTNWAMYADHIVPVK